jgi:hypothetical protein
MRPVTEVQATDRTISTIQAGVDAGRSALTEVDDDATQDFRCPATSFGLVLAAILLVSGGLLTWASSFVGDQVNTQLSQQQIFFPPKGPATASPEIGPFLNQYAGQQLLTGQQAEAYADHFIAVHLKEAGGGLTYAQLSTKAQAAPDDTKLAGQVATMFKGETLRGLLLNAYAFGTMGRIAGIAGIGAFVGAALMLLLSLLGFAHLRRVAPDGELGSPSPPAHT